MNNYGNNWDSLLSSEFVIIFPHVPFESGDVLQLFVSSTVVERNVTKFWL